MFTVDEAKNKYNRPFTELLEKLIPLLTRNSKEMPKPSHISLYVAFLYPPVSIFLDDYSVASKNKGRV